MLCLCRTEDGAVFVCGQNHRGQLGLGHSADVLTLQLCPRVTQRVAKVACGWDFTLFLTGEQHLTAACCTKATLRVDISQSSHISDTDAYVFKEEHIFHSLATPDKVTSVN